MNQSFNSNLIINDNNNNISDKKKCALCSNDIKINEKRIKCNSCQKPLIHYKCSDTHLKKQKSITVFCNHCSKQFEIKSECTTNAFLKYMVQFLIRVWNLCQYWILPSFICAYITKWIMFTLIVYMLVIPNYICNPNWRSRRHIFFNDINNHNFSLSDFVLNSPESNIESIRGNPAYNVRISRGLEIFNIANFTYGLHTWIILYWIGYRLVVCYLVKWAIRKDIKIKEKK